MKYVGVLAAIGLSYILGSIPFGYVIGRLLTGVDVRTKGSGNIGATNVLRVLGWGPALLVLCCDLGKGALGVYLGILAQGTLGGALCGMAAALGGAYSVFLGFQGGKGIGVGSGIVLVTHAHRRLQFLSWCGRHCAAHKVRVTWVDYCRSAGAICSLCVSLPS